MDIFEITKKSTHFEAFDEIHQNVIDGISDNMASLVQPGMYGAINTAENTKIDSMLFNSSQSNIRYRIYSTIDGQVISAGELVAKTQYLCSVQENTDWHWKQQPLQQTIIVTTRTILRPRLDVIIIRDVQDIPKNVCNRIQAKNSYKDIQLL